MEIYKPLDQETGTVYSKKNVCFDKSVANMMKKPTCTEQRENNNPLPLDISRKQWGDSKMDVDIEREAIIVKNRVGGCIDSVVVISEDKVKNMIQRELVKEVKRLRSWKLRG